MNRTLALSLAATLWPTVADATQPSTQAIVEPGDREFADGHVRRTATPSTWRANAVHPARARGWNALAAEMGSAWATWDDHGEHPRQIIGNGLPAPGVIASAAEAERFAVAVLTRHLALLAPGTSPSDFVIVANHVSAGIRSVGFAQRSAGREVVGGQIGLVFKHDRLVMLTSLAKTHATIPTAATVVDDITVRDRARTWIDDDLHPTAMRSRGTVQGPMVLPVGDALTGPQYREVVRTEVDSDGPRTRFAVYLDAATGEPVARESLLFNASGLVFYNVAERSPIFGRSDRPTPFTEHLVDGSAQLSDSVGFVNFAGPTSNVQPGLSGLFARIIDESGPLASGTVVLSDGGGVSWNVSNDALLDAQLTTYAHLLVVKDRIRSLDPALAWLDQPITATVNIDDQCNAMSDGDSVFFLQGGDTCENTGRMSDVVYHEVGHSVHFQSLIPGVGSFDGSLSEGISDYLSTTIVNDSGVGRGFFYDESPLRELDPDGFEWTWPQDSGEVHDAGRIIGGALWDLRTLLIEKYGPDEGIRRTDIIYYEGTRRAVDMPSMYGAALIVNDDDGNLDNGTPDACEINAAFGAHGLFSAGPDGESVRAEPVAEGLQVRVDLSVPSFPACPVNTLAFIEWGPRDGGGATQVAEMIASGDGYQVVVPALPDGQVLNYRVLVAYDTGTQRALPANLAQPWFEHWFGPVEPIWCTSFADGDSGWDLDGRWEVGVPEGASSDPPVAAGPDPLVLGVALGGTGLYTPWSTDRADGPAVDITGSYQSVRLHYQRWLTVEDGFFDQAHIFANGDPVWSNFASVDDSAATTHHRDSQWVFHDVDITPWAATGQVQLAFGLNSDGGLEMGGWNVDELCIVGYLPGDQPPAGCGDGVIAIGEECDDGNLEDLDGCSAQCTNEEPTDTPSTGSDDAGDDGPGLTDEGRLLDRGCTCRSQGRGDLPVGLGLIVWLVVARRRRYS